MNRILKIFTFVLAISFIVTINSYPRITYGEPITSTIAVSALIGQLTSNLKSIIKEAQKNR